MALYVFLHSMSLIVYLCLISNRFKANFDNMFLIILTIKFCMLMHYFVFLHLNKMIVRILSKICDGI